MTGEHVATLCAGRSWECEPTLSEQRCRECATYYVPGKSDGCCVHDGKPWGESAFVPMSSVSTPTNFYLEPLTDDGSGNDVYTIMPATFEPGKVGSFFLSVVADCEFMLKRDTSTDRKPRN